MVFIACLGRSLQYLCPYRNSHHKGRVWTSEGKILLFKCNLHLLGTTLTPWIYIFLMLFYSIILQQQKKDCWRTIYIFDKARWGPSISYSCRATEWSVTWVLIWTLASRASSDYPTLERQTSVTFTIITKIGYGHQQARSCYSKL